MSFLNKMPTHSSGARKRKGSRPHRVVFPSLLATVFAFLATTEALGQDVGFFFVTTDDAQTQMFARRGLGLEIARDLPSIRITDTDRSEETFREVAAPILVRTYDSLRVGSKLRAEVDELLRISGDKLSTLDFVFIDDASGLTEKETGGLTSVAVNDDYYVWPATNLVAWYDRALVEVKPYDEVDTTLTIYGPEDLDPEKRAEELLWEANFLDESADLLEELYAEATKELPGLRRAVKSSADEAASKEAILDTIRVQLEAVESAHMMVAGLHNLSSKVNEVLRVGREVAAGGGIPVFIPDLPTYEEEIGQQIDDFVRLGRETRDVEADFNPIRRRLRTLKIRQAQIVNEMERWQREAKANRERAEILRRRAGGLQTGELHLADYRSGVDTTKFRQGWSYDADIVIGSNQARRFVELFSDWSAWEGILLHRVLNGQFLSAGQILATMQESGPEDSPILKAGWSEVAFLGSGFDEADLSTPAHQAVETGIGLFLSGRHSHVFREKLNAFFDKTGPKYVFPINRAVGSGLPEEFAGRYLVGSSDFGSLKGEVAHQMPYATGTVEVGKLSWENVPADYLLQSSSTVTAFLLMVSTGWSDQAVVMNPIYAFCRDYWGDLNGRDLPSLVRYMSWALQKTMGVLEVQEGQLRWVSALMPLAYLDVLTNFGLSRTDFFPLGTEDDRPELTDRYWGSIRQGLRLGLDRHGLFVGGSNLKGIAETTNRYLVCAVGKTGGEEDTSPDLLVEECWPQLSSE